VTSVAARHRFTDTTNGFRGHSRRLLTDPRVAPMREVFDTYELLAYLPIRAARLGHACCEVPVTRAYPPAGAIPTKIHGRAAQFDLVKILARAALGGYDPVGA
jgi:dolichol-phosphate mannosyltransferase